MEIHTRDVQHGHVEPDQLDAVPKRWKGMDIKELKRAASALARKLTEAYACRIDEIGLSEAVANIRRFGSSNLKKLSTEGCDRAQRLYSTIVTGLNAAASLGTEEAWRLLGSLDESFIIDHRYQGCGFSSLEGSMRIH